MEIERIDSLTKKPVDFGFYAQCWFCHGIGSISIPESMLSDESVKHMRKLEMTGEINFCCPKCTYLEEEFENDYENIPNWIEVLEKDNQIVFVSKDKLIVVENETMTESNFLIRYHGFQRYNKK